MPAHIPSPLLKSFTILSVVNFLVLFKIIKYKCNQTKKYKCLNKKVIFSDMGVKFCLCLLRVPYMLSLNATSLSEGQSKKKKKNLHSETEIINEK